MECLIRQLSFSSFTLECVCGVSHCNTHMQKPVETEVVTQGGFQIPFFPPDLHKCSTINHYSVSSICLSETATWRFVIPCVNCSCNVCSYSQQAVLFIFLNKKAVLSSFLSLIPVLSFLMTKPILSYLKYSS